MELEQVSMTHKHSGLLDVCSGYLYRFVWKGATYQNLS